MRARVDARGSAGFDSPAFVQRPRSSPGGRWRSRSTSPRSSSSTSQFRKQAHTLSLTEIGLTLGLLLAAPVGPADRAARRHVRRPRRQPTPEPAAPARQVRVQPRRAAALQRHRADRLPLARLAERLGAALWVLVLVACAVAHVVGILLVSTVIAIAEERFQAPQLGRTLVTSTLGALATASLGLAVVELLEVRPASRSSCSSCRFSRLVARLPRLHGAARAAGARRVPLRVDARDAGRAGVRPRSRAAPGRRAPAATRRVRRDPPPSRFRGRRAPAQRQRSRGRVAHAPGGALRARRTPAAFARSRRRLADAAHAAPRRHTPSTAFLAHARARGRDRGPATRRGPDVRPAHRRRTRSATSARSPRPTSSCSAPSPAMRASCSRTAGSSIRSPR